MRARSRQTLSLLHCAFRRFHVIEGKNPRDQITSDRRCKHSWSDCILMHSIHSLVKGQKNVGYIRGHTCCACLITTWRLGLRATKFCRPPPGSPAVARNYLVWFKPGAFSNKTIAYVLQKIGNAHRELLNTPSSNG